MGCQTIKQLTAALLAACVACGGSSNTRSSGSHRSSDDDVIRYRLKLRHNPVDAGEAFRCYARCQSEPTPQGYFECLSRCPGFEVTPGAYCAKDEVPPVAACLTARKVRARQEVNAGLIVLAVIGEFLLIVATSSLCSSSSAQCYQYRY